MLGTTHAKARAIVGEESWDFPNNKVNGKIYVNADNVRAYLRKADTKNKNMKI